MLGGGRRPWNGLIYKVLGAAAGGENFEITRGTFDIFIGNCNNMARPIGSRSHWPTLLTAMCSDAMAVACDVRVCSTCDHCHACVPCYHCHVGRAMRPLPCAHAHTRTAFHNLRKQRARVSM